jgi:hypothetical protein
MMMLDVTPYMMMLDVTPYMMMLDVTPYMMMLDVTPYRMMLDVTPYMMMLDVTPYMMMLDVTPYRMMLSYIIQLGNVRTFKIIWSSKENMVQFFRNQDQRSNKHFSHKNSLNTKFQLEFLFH